MRRRAQALLAILAVFAPSAVRAQTGGISISGQWMRALGGDLPAAGYFTLRNDTGHTVRLTGAASPACASLTLHQTVREHTRDRVMSAMSALAPENAGQGRGQGGDMASMSMMQAVGAVPIQAHGSMEFAPGGYHLMCEQPAPSMRPGQSIAVTLRLDGKDGLTSDFPVKGPRG